MMFWLILPLLALAAALSDEVMRDDH